MDDDFDPGCTRTLFVGNIEKTTTFSDLKEAFERYGEIVVSNLVTEISYLSYCVYSNLEFHKNIHTGTSPWKVNENSKGERVAKESMELSSIFWGVVE